MTHDPLAAIPAKSVPLPNPWESLAQQCRWLADLAARYADTDPADLAPTSDDDDLRDPLADLDGRALAIRANVAACRRVTWQTLADSGMSAADIARRWGVSRQAVSQALVRPDRPR